MAQAFYPNIMKLFCFTVLFISLTVSKASPQGLTPEKAYADAMNVANKNDKPAKDFKATSLNGAKFELTKMRGHVIVLNIWTTTCIHCIDEMNDFNRMKTKFKGKGVIFVAMDPVDNQEDIKSFLKNHAIDYHILYNPNSTFVSNYAAIAYPTNYVINKHGIIRLAKQGFEKSNAHDIALAVTKSL
jgi:peroxiredoxin